MIYQLPYPPTVNHYYSRTRQGRVYLSKRAQEYRAAVSWQLVQEKMLTGRIKLHIDVFPPDHRKRDLDNINKCLLDTLEHAKLIENDSMIYELSMKKHEPVNLGKVIIDIHEMEY